MSRTRAHVADVWGLPASAIPGAGRSAFELLNSIGRASGIRALLVMGSNIAVSAPHATAIHARLKALEFLVVSDFFLSETAQMADVVLPSAQWAEEDGTLTNLEGRVLMRRRVIDPPEGVRTDLDTLCAIGQKLGHARQFSYSSTEAVFDELRRATRGGPADYSGISYARLEAGDGVFWPCPALDHAGTPRLFADAFPTENGRARFHAVSHRSIAESATADYPLYLTTGRLLAQYQSGTQTRRVRALQELAGEPMAEIHPATAGAAGLSVRRSRHADDTPRRRDVRRQDDVDNPRRHGVRSVSLGRRTVGQQPHECRTRSDEQDARVQGVRRAYRQAGWMTVS